MEQRRQGLCQALAALSVSFGIQVAVAILHMQKETVPLLPAATCRRRMTQ